jgi:hypothetical protein
VNRRDFLVGLGATAAIAPINPINPINPIASDPWWSGRIWWADLHWEKDPSFLGNRWIGIEPVSSRIQAVFIEDAELRQTVATDDDDPFEDEEPT